MPVRPLRRICVQWPRVGPYHRARLDAADGLLRAAGVEMVAMETASADALYDWKPEALSGTYARRTLFPDTVFDTVAPARLHAAVTAALDDIDPDAVAIHSYSLPDARACLAWCRRRRRAAVLMYDSSEANAARTGWREAAKRVLVSSYDAALVAGGPQGRYAVRLGIDAGRVFAGYDVVDNDFFARRAQTVRDAPDDARSRLPGLADPDPFFLASARFMERKDLPTLLRAYGSYRARQMTHGGEPPWRLVLLGDGILRPSLERLLAAESIVGVEMPGWRQLGDLPAYYALAGAFVHTATVDQWGLVVNEAMAAGLPVVVSTGAGCTEDLVRDGENGFTFAPGDASALARHLAAVAHAVDRAAFAARSAEIIAAWPLERFGTNLLAAAQAGLGHADRPFDARAQALIGALRLLARSPRAFHSVED